jgi:hypothetical protein
MIDDDDDDDDDDECGAFGGMIIGRGNRSTRRKPAIKYLKLVTFDKYKHKYKYCQEHVLTEESF